MVNIQLNKPYIVKVHEYESVYNGRIAVPRGCQFRKDKMEYYCRIYSDEYMTRQLTASFLLYAEDMIPFVPPGTTTFVPKYRF